MVHDEVSPLAQTTVKLIHHDDYRGGLVSFTVDDWWDRVQGDSWHESRHHLALSYAGRRQSYSLPEDDNVLYGRLADGSECLIHVSEIEDF